MSETNNSLGTLPRGLIPRQLQAERAGDLDRELQMVEQTVQAICGKQAQLEVIAAFYFIGEEADGELVRDDLTDDVFAIEGGA
ncbi:MAG TPA: hypothetical protein VGC85_11835, partial [Chthoniobacterales bacterium]